MTLKPAVRLQGHRCSFHQFENARARLVISWIDVGLRPFLVAVALHPLVDLHRQQPRPIIILAVFIMRTAPKAAQATETNLPVLKVDTTHQMVSAPATSKPKPYRLAECAALVLD